MNTSNKFPLEKVREILTLNAQKGEPYRILFIGDPVTYTGIPIALPRMTGEDDDAFEMKIVEPEQKSGMMRRSIHEISRLEKCP